jgi:hypothetical protein
MRIEITPRSFRVDQSADEVRSDQQRSWMVVGRNRGRHRPTRRQFTYLYKDMHRTKQNITELIPGKKTVWRVLESDLSFLKDKNEWTGTEIVLMSLRKGARRKSVLPTRVWSPKLNAMVAARTPGTCP